jgi:hypothetical protein
LGDERPAGPLLELAGAITDRPAHWPWGGMII